MWVYGNELWSRDQNLIATMGVENSARSKKYCQVY